MSDVTVHDLIKTAAQQNAVDFKAAFDSLVMDRVADAVQARKQEIAQSYFDQKEQEAQSDENTEATA